MGKKSKIFKLVTPSESEYLEMIRDFVGKIAQKAGFNDEYITKIQLAVDEACTNVVKHAYKGIRRKDITVEVELNQEKMTIAVIDHGRGFDISRVLQRDVNGRLNEYRRGGLGIHLMRIIMDKVDFSIQPRVENRVTMVKYINREDSPEKKERQKMLMEKSHERKK